MDAPVKGIVIHHTAGNSMNGIVGQYNYAVDRDGKAYELRPDGTISGHIGDRGSKIAAENNFGWDNQNTIGISAVAPTAKDVTPAQTETIKALAEAIGRAKGVSPQNVKGHGQVAAKSLSPFGVVVETGRRGADEGRDVAAWANGLSEWGRSPSQLAEILTAPRPPADVPNTPPAKTVATPTLVSPSKPPTAPGKEKPAPAWPLPLPVHKATPPPGGWYDTPEARAAKGEQAARDAARDAPFSPGGKSTGPASEQARGAAEEAKGAAEARGKAEAAAREAAREAAEAKGKADAAAREAAEAKGKADAAAREAAEAKGKAEQAARDAARDAPFSPGGKSTGPAAEHARAAAEEAKGKAEAARGAAKDAAKAAVESAKEAARTAEAARDAAKEAARQAGRAVGAQSGGGQGPQGAQGISGGRGTQSGATGGSGALGGNPQGAEGAPGAPGGQSGKGQAGPGGPSGRARDGSISGNPQGAEGRAGARGTQSGPGQVGPGAPFGSGQPGPAPARQLRSADPRTRHDRIRYRSSRQLPNAGKP